jgi:hypothetical protein
MDAGAVTISDNRCSSCGFSHRGYSCRVLWDGRVLLSPAFDGCASTTITTFNVSVGTGISFSSESFGSNTLPVSPRERRRQYNNRKGLKKPDIKPPNFISQLELCAPPRRALRSARGKTGRLRRDARAKARRMEY